MDWPAENALSYISSLSSRHQTKSLGHQFRWQANIWVELVSRIKCFGPGDILRPDWQAVSNQWDRLAIDNDTTKFFHDFFKKSPKFVTNRWLAWWINLNPCKILCSIVLLRSSRRLAHTCTALTSTSFCYFSVVRCATPLDPTMSFLGWTELGCSFRSCICRCTSNVAHAMHVVESFLASLRRTCLVLKVMPCMLWLNRFVICVSSLESTII
jgi:hypothetical protein